MEVRECETIQEIDMKLRWKRNVPMEAMNIPSHFQRISDFRMEALNEDRLLAFYDRMEFHDLKKRVQNRIQNIIKRVCKRESTKESKRE